MQPIQTIQLMATMLSTLLLLLAYTVRGYRRPLLWTSLALMGLYVVSLLIAQPPRAAYTLALQFAFPVMPAELAYQVSTILIAPIVGALLCTALRIVWPGILTWPNRLLLLLAHINLLQLLLLLCLCLASCKPKPAQAPAAPAPLPTVDSTRQTLQRQADASRSSADQASQSSQSSVTTFERDVKTYDSIQVKLR